MNDFSKYLSALVLSKEINVSQMASFCKIDRSSMYKIIHGTRKPSSESLVELICLYLKLTPEESSLLIEKYRILQIGEENYRRRKATAAFLHNCRADHLPSIPSQYLSIPAMPSRTGKDIEVLSGKSSILSAIKYIIHAEQQNTDSCIYIRMQPDQMAFDIIRTLCECKSTGSGHNIRVQHIIALDEKKILTDSDLYNLNTLNTLIPALATIPNYELLYYYTNIFTGNSAFSFLPYALISKDLVLQISANLEFGTLQRQPETVAFFKEIYLDIRAASIPLTVEIRDIRDLIYCGLQHKKGNGHFSFRLGFLMNIVLTESLLEKYINKSISNRNFIIKYASEILKTDIQAFKNSRSTTIISESEIRFFMESGILPSSNGLLEPFEYEDRVTLLRNYINLILDNPLSTLLFLKDSALNSDSYNKIYIDDSGANILLGNNFHFRRILNIRDPGILSLLIDFFENIPENICFQPSESINKAQMVLRNYS